MNQILYLPIICLNSLQVRTVLSSGKEKQEERQYKILSMHIFAILPSTLQNLFSQTKWLGHKDSSAKLHGGSNLSFKNIIDPKKGSTLYLVRLYMYRV